MTIKIAFYSVKLIKNSRFQKLLNDIDVPFSFAYLKSYIDKYLPGVAECQLINDISVLESEKFDILGLSSYTDAFNLVQVAAKKAKEINPCIFTIVGSFHISALPQTLPSSVDCGVIGEGEETFKEIIEAMRLEQSRPLPVETLKKINGLVLRENNNLICTPQRELITPLERIPFPDRNILTAATSELNKSIITSRGCPYNCNFCANNILWNNSRYRYFPVDYVIEELKSIINNFSDIKAIQMIDPLFTTNKPRIAELVKAIETEGINRYIEFSVSGRANLIDREMCELLARMNVKSVFIGAESLSSKILNIMNKQISLDWLYKYNIKANCSFIFGTPGETPEDIYATFDFIMKNKTNDKIWGFSGCALTPFPGTYYWDYAKEKGLVQDDMDFAKLSEMIVTNIPSVYTFDEWRKLREGYAIYMNSDNIEESKFYDLLGQFYKEVAPLILASARPVEL